MAKLAPSGTELTQHGQRFALVPAGPQALNRLGALIAELKGQNPLAPVTVVVPHSLAGLATRRALAIRPAGVVNVRFDILPRIADGLAAASLAAQGLTPLNNTVLAAAVRHVLRHEPGTTLASVAAHPATETEVTRFVGMYNSLSEPAQATLAAHSATSRDLVSLVTRVNQHLAHRYSRHQALAEAASLVATSLATADSSNEPVVAYLPSYLGPHELALYEAWAAADRLWVIAALTGSTEADAVLRPMLSRFEPLLGAPQVVPAAATNQTPMLNTANAATKLKQTGSASSSGRANSSEIGVNGAVRVVSTSDPAEEVRAVLREVVERWHNGTPLERMAVLYPTADPYLGLLYNQAQAGEIAIAGAAVSSLRASVAGATLVAGLKLKAHELVRHDFISWLQSGPIVDSNGEMVPVAEWDLLTRRAGIVTGPIEAWNAKLSAHAGSSSHAASAADALRRFLDSFSQRLGRVHASRTWSDLAKNGHQFMEWGLGTASVRSAHQWPAHQLQAFELVEEALDLLAALDPIEPSPTVPGFISALENELDTEYGRLGNFGNGLLVAPLHHGIGLNLDWVAVVGLNEGIVPVRSSANVFLTEIGLDETHLGLPGVNEANASGHYQLLGALASAEERSLTTARGDLRDKRAKMPSRWLLQLVSEHVGETVTSESLAQIRPSSESHLTVQSVASFSGGLHQARYFSSLAERDLAELSAWTDNNSKLANLPNLTSDFSHLHPSLLAATQRKAGFNPYTGLVSSHTAGLDRVMSATSLESWAVCPRRYFFSRVLGLDDEEAPEEIDQISALDRGSLVHETLDRFFSEVIAEGPKPYDQDWRPEDHSRLDKIFEEVVKGYEERGRTGFPTLWRLERQVLLNDLHSFLDHDALQRGRWRSTPVASELRFGYSDAGLTITLPDGETVQFRGSADRVDITDTNQLIVLDYKTGSGKPYTNISEEEPLLNGTHLQLPLYGLAAIERFANQLPAGETPRIVNSAYWFITERGKYELKGYEVSSEVIEEFKETIGAIVTGIRHGVFPGVPDPIASPTTDHSNCKYCDFNSLCRLDRTEEWERVHLDPAIAPFRNLTPVQVDDASQSTAETKA